MIGLVGLHPQVRAGAEYAAEVMAFNSGGKLFQGKVQGGIRPTFTSGGRTHEEQEQLYANRASNPYPVNRPGDSAHEYGLAFDSVVPERWWPLWTAVREYVGFRVPSNDRIHAEVPNWRQYVAVR